MYRRFLLKKETLSRLIEESTRKHVKELFQKILRSSYRRCPIMEEKRKEKRRDEEDQNEEWEDKAILLV